jgi:hypothetical protein
MADLAADKAMQYKEGVEQSIPMGASKEIFAGSLVCLDGTTRYAEHASDAANKVFVGVAREYKKDVAAAAGTESILVRQRGRFLLDYYEADAAQEDVGKSVFVKDDQTVALAASVSHLIYAGVICEIESVTQVWVDIYPALLQTDVATHVADSSAAHAASAISAAAGGLAIPANTQLALAEIYQNILSAQGIIPIPTPYFSAAGVALAVFADGASDVPGFCVTAKGMGVRWNNHAAPLPVAAKVLVPPDADITADMTFHAITAKVGATAGDLTKLTIEVFNNVVGALYDADTDFGGDTDAMINASTKTIQHVTRALALANLAAYPNLMEITIKPKAGTLGTDDLIMFGAFIVYQKKLLTS